MKYIAFFLLSIVVISCSFRDNKYGTRYFEIKDSTGVTIRGNMDIDSNFIGEILFLKNNVIVERKFYSHGIANGKVITYNDQGIVKQISYNSYGVTNGPVMQYNNKGNLIREQVYYWGKLIGPEVVYDSSGDVQEYSFYNFENEVIYYMRFNGAKLEEKYSNFNPVTYDSLTVDDTSKLRVFIYNIRPPKMKYTYSICVLKSKDLKSIREIINLNGDTPFFERIVNTNIDENVCVKIVVFDSITNHLTHMYHIYDKNNKEIH